MYIVDLNISLCFESASPCALDVEVFKQTVLKKRECPKYTGFLQSGKCQREILDSNNSDATNLKVNMWFPFRLFSDRVEAGE